MPAPTREPVIVMRAGANPVTGGGNSAGWVSGSHTNLAANTTVVELFDLGPDWDQYVMLQVSMSSSAPSSGLDQISFGGRPTPVASLEFSRLRDLQGTPGTMTYSSLTSANGFGVWYLRPMGRYLVISSRNADATNAQGAAQTVVAAYPA